MEYNEDPTVHSTSVGTRSEYRLLNSFIYCLVDPRDETIFYVGQSGTGSREPKKYVEGGYAGTRRSVCRQIFRIIRDGFKPSWEILEEVELNQLDDAERFWIANFRSVGARLTNITDGGVGTRGHHHSIQAKEKIAEAGRRRVWSAETKQKMSVAQLGNKKALGKKRSPETLEKMRKSMIGKNVGKRHSPEAIEKIRVASVENGKRPEVKAKLSAASNRRWSRARLGEGPTTE